MARIRIRRSITERRAREDKLRRAHQVAFERIRDAGPAAEKRAEITKAVEGLIAACEEFVCGPETEVLERSA